MLFVSERKRTRVTKMDIEEATINEPSSVGFMLCIVAACADRIVINTKRTTTTNVIFSNMADSTTEVVNLFKLKDGVWSSCGVGNVEIVNDTIIEMNFDGEAGKIFCLPLHIFECKNKGFDCDSLFFFVS